ncbi:MAG: alpha-ribazole phosphatase [Promethearchaeota archaeon]
MDIYLIRHTNVKLDNDVCYGQSDVDIADSFEHELKELKKKLPFSPQMVFYSSPLKRCTLLSEKLSTTTPIIDKRLLEMDFGEWELKKWNLINRVKFQEWTKDFINKPCPNGESFLDLYRRSCRFFEDIIEKGHKKVGIITHSGVIRSILSYLLKIPLKSSFKLQIGYGKVSKINLNQSKDYSLIINIEYVNK